MSFPITIPGINFIHFKEQITPIGKIKIDLHLYLTKNIPHTFGYDVIAEEQSIFINKIDNYTIDWDDREFFITFGVFNIKLIDIKKNLFKAIKSSYFDSSSTKIIVSKFNGSEYEEFYIGYFDEENYSFDKDNILELNFKPNSNLLSETSTNIDGNWNDIFNGKYDAGFSINSKTKVGWNLKVNFVNLIKDIFQLVDADVEFNNNWEYESAIFNQTTYKCLFNDLTIPIGALFNSAEANQWEFLYQNYLQVLKQAMLSIGMFGGFISANKVVFKTMFDYTANEIIECNKNNLIDYKQVVSERPLKFIRLKNHTGYIVGEMGINTGLQEDMIELINNWGQFKIPYSGEHISLWKIHSSRLGNSDYGNFLTYYYSQYYLSIFNTHRDIIELNGINYKINNVFSCDEYIYMPLKLAYNLDKNTTEITAVPIKKL